LKIKPYKLSKIIVILGPTASGKSELAVKLALRLSSGQAKKLYGINGAEIVSADSRQVYKGLNIGSGKITPDTKNSLNFSTGQVKKKYIFTHKGIPHHCIDVASPKRIFTVAQYQKLAKRALEKILAKNKLPIICGGTGFYIDALIYNYHLPEVPPQPNLRKQLEKKSAEELFKQLKKLDPRRAKNIDRCNKRRLIRALEIILTTGKIVPPKNYLILRSHDKIVNYEILKIAIKKSPEQLKKSISQRLKERLKQGMVKEVEKLHGQGLSWQRLDNLGLEYRYVSRYLRGFINKKEMVDSILKESWHYAKRQMTWFKNDKEIIWIHPHTNKGLNYIIKLCKEFLNINKKII